MSEIVSVAAAFTIALIGLGCARWIVAKIETDDAAQRAREQFDRIARDLVRLCESARRSALALQELADACSKF